MNPVVTFIRKAYSLHIVRYTSVGAVNTIVIFGLFFLFGNLIGVGPIRANRIAYIGGLMVNFTLNKVFTFRSRRFNAAEVVLFLFSWAVSYGIQSLVFRGLMDGPGWTEDAAAIPAYLLYGLVFFLMCRYLAFNPGVTGPVTGRKSAELPAEADTGNS